MKTSDFYYDLPKELIAQDPLEDRSLEELLSSSGSCAISSFGRS